MENILIQMSIAFYKIKFSYLSSDSYAVRFYTVRACVRVGVC